MAPAARGRHRPRLVARGDAHAAREAGTAGVAGQRVAVGASRIHVLPTPVSSFSAVATTEDDCARIAAAPLLQPLATRMQTRVNHRIEPALGEPSNGKPARALAPPGVAGSSPAPAVRLGSPGCCAMAPRSCCARSRAAGARARSDSRCLRCRAAPRWRSRRACCAIARRGRVSRLQRRRCPRASAPRSCATCSMRAPRRCGARARHAYGTPLRRLGTELSKELAAEDAALLIVGLPLRLSKPGNGSARSRHCSTRAAATRC